MTSYRFVFAGLFALAATPVFADDLPRQLTGELIRIEHENCKTSTGYGIDFVQLVDIDGDGKKDAVLDYSKALCGGQPEPYCGDAGCLVVAYSSAKGGWKKVFEGHARSFKAEGGALLIDGKPVGH